MFTGHEMKEKCFNLWTKQVNENFFIDNKLCFLETKDQKESDIAINKYKSLCNK